MITTKISMFDRKMLQTSAEDSKKRKLSFTSKPKFAKKFQTKPLYLEISPQKLKLSPIMTDTPTFIHGNWNIRGHKLKAIYSSNRKSQTPAGQLHLNFFTRPTTSNALPPSKLKHRRHLSVEVKEYHAKTTVLARPTTSFSLSKTNDDNVKLVYKTTPTKAIHIENNEEFGIKSPFIYKQETKITHKKSSRAYTPYSNLQVISHTPIQMANKSPEPRRKSLGLQCDDFSTWEFPEDT